MSIATLHANLPPLHRASALGDAVMAQPLLERGEAVNARDAHGKTSLHYAAEWGSMAVARLLSAHAAHVDAKDASQNTPLFYAVRRVHKEVVEFLLSQGADPCARVSGTLENEATSVIAFALYAENREIVCSLLQSPRIGTLQLLMAWRGGYAEIAFPKIAQRIAEGKIALADRAELAVKGMMHFSDDILRMLAERNLVPRWHLRAGKGFRPLATIALETRDPKIISLMRPDGCAYEIMHRVMLAHLSVFQGGSKMDRLPLVLDGGMPSLMYETIAISLHMFSSRLINQLGLRPEEMHRLADAFEAAKRPRSAQEVLREWKENGLCLFPCIIPGHVFVLLLYRDAEQRTFCCICNPGMRPAVPAEQMHAFATVRIAQNMLTVKPVWGFEVSSDFLTEELVETIQKPWIFTNKAFHFYYEVLPMLQIASVHSRALIYAVESIGLCKQKGETCAYTSAKCALRAALTFLALQRKHPWERTWVQERIRTAVKEWSAFILENYLVTYVQTSVQRDVALVRHTLEKLNKKRAALGLPARGEAWLWSHRA